MLPFVENLDISTTHCWLKASRQFDLPFDFTLVEKVFKVILDFFGDLIQKLCGFLVPLALLNSGASHQSARHFLKNIGCCAFLNGRFVEILLTHAQIDICVFDLDDPQNIIVLVLIGSLHFGVENG